jgi:hypothetical protein
MHSDLPGPDWLYMPTNLPLQVSHLGCGENQEELLLPPIMAEAVRGQGSDAAIRLDEVLKGLCETTTSSVMPTLQKEPRCDIQSAKSGASR